MDIELTVNGFVDTVSFADDEIESIHIPILRKITDQAGDGKGTGVVMLGAPPGAGKSTLAAFWEMMSKREDQFVTLQSLSMDGFHYPNTVLRSTSGWRDGIKHPLIELKGAPETYDVSALVETVRRLKRGKRARWPVYDRNLHEPVPDAIMVTAPVVVIEGNWMLLDEPGWRSLSDLANLRIFLETREALVRDRLVQRKRRGGASSTTAEAHYARTDAPNIRRALENRLPADITLRLSSIDDGQHMKLVSDVDLGTPTKGVAD